MAGCRWGAARRMGYRRSLLSASPEAQSFAQVRVLRRGVACYRIERQCSTRGPPSRSTARVAGTGLPGNNRGARHLLQIPFGVHFYSADGKRLLLLTKRTAPAHAQFYDIQQPLQPALLCERDIPAPVMTACVSDDGAFVALEQVDPTDRSRSEELLYDGTLNAIAGPIVTHLSSIGLQFEGEFLFVGIQDAAVPAYVHAISTADVLLFDLSRLR